MGRYIADQNKLGFFYESGTYAVSSGTMQWIGQVQDHTLDESTGVIPVRYLGGGDRNVDQFVDGPQDYTGTISYFPQDWKFLWFTLGSAVDAGSPSPYTHTLSELNSGVLNGTTSGTLCPFLSFGLEDSKTVSATGQNFNRTVQGAMINTFTLNGTQGEILSAEIAYTAQNVAFSSGAASAVTAATTRPFLWRDCTLQIPSGTSYSTMKDFSLTINNNLESPHYLNGSVVIAPSIPLNRDYELTVTLDLQSTEVKTLWDQYFIGGSTFNTMMTVNASTGSRDAFFVMSGCKLMDMEAPSPMEGVNETTLTIQPKNMIVNVNDTIFRYKPW